MCDAYSSPCILVLDQQKVPESGQFHISEAFSASPPLEKPLALIECSELASSAFCETHAPTHAHAHTDTHTGLKEFSPCWYCS